MDEDLSGDAPVDTTAIADTPSNTPAPITETTPRASIDRAFDAVEKGETTTERTKVEKPTTETAPVGEGERARNPDGTFKATDLAAPKPVAADKPEQPTGEQPKPVTDAPARFDADAKAAWAQTPDSVKGATTRALRELEQGVERFKNAYAPFHPFVDLASKNGANPVETLKGYVGVDLLLSQNFEQGIQQIFANKGQSIKEWAAKIMGQPADQNAVAQDQTITELRKVVSGLERKLAGVDQTIEQRFQQRDQGAQVNSSLEQFIGALPETDKQLFKELDGEIAKYLADPSTTLSDAFASAKRDAQARYQRMFGQASDATTQANPAAAQTRTPDPTPQTRAGELSISGAPGSGSNPSIRKTPSSPRAAIDTAFAELGLG